MDYPEKVTPDFISDHTFLLSENTGCIKSTPRLELRLPLQVEDLTTTRIQLISWENEQNLILI